MTNNPSFGLNSKQKKVKEIPKAKTTMAMHCLGCENIFYLINFGTRNSADCCECRNMKISYRPFSGIAPGKKQTYFLSLTVQNRKNVKLYSVYKKDLVRVTPHKEY